MLISRKLQGFEQSCSEARLATPMSTQTAPNYRVRNFKFKKNQSFVFWKTLTKSLKHHIWKTTKIWAVIIGCKVPSPWDYSESPPTKGLGVQNFEEKKLVWVFWNLKKITKKRHISKTTRNGALIFGGKIRNSWEYSEAPNYREGNFKFWKY